MPIVLPPSNWRKSLQNKGWSSIFWTSLSFFMDDVSSFQSTYPVHGIRENMETRKCLLWTCAKVNCPFCVNVFVCISTIASHVIVNRHILTQLCLVPADREPKHENKKERGWLLLCIIASPDANVDNVELHSTMLPCRPYNRISQVNLTHFLSLILLAGKSIDLAVVIKLVTRGANDVFSLSEMFRQQNQPSFYFC